MKSCSYCGRENEDNALKCTQCGTELSRPEVRDRSLTDPGGKLVVVASFRDLIHATFLKDELEGVGIMACIPEELGSSPYGGIIGIVRFTVRVAARDYDAAKEALAHLNVPANEDAAQDRGDTAV